MSSAALSGKEVGPSAGRRPSGQATKAVRHTEELGLPPEGTVGAVTHQRINT